MTPRTAAASFGVEEEFLLVDAESGHPVPAGPDVLAAAHAATATAEADGATATADPGPAEATAGPGAAEPRAAPRAQPRHPTLSAELLTTQIESATPVCTELDELTAQLTRARAVLAAAAARGGARLLPSGTPPLGGGPAAVTAGARPWQIMDRYTATVSDYHICGCHVHVGVPDRETAVAVLNHLRPWLPTLLALSANSPFRHGRDTGYASWRTVEQSRFPGAGIPPHFPSAAAYDATLERLIECGVLVDDRVSFWSARPSPRYPTVELRVADACGTVAEAVLQAALSRALVRTALTALAAGREAAGPDDQVAAAALWSASRYGLSGPAVHPRLARRVPALTLVEALIEDVTPALEEAGDLSAVRALVADLLTRGTGAERQRAAGAGDPAAAVRHLTRATTDSLAEEATP
ncbi:carboxylate-amine ligase [Streptomyces sp. URMC 123]|uniref:carboxylate-amine ligase n=1 Tax=Streptomyces sp. URMC 123 TaxID=3423403 RepID=UPI003F19D75E